MNVYIQLIIKQDQQDLINIVNNNLIFLYNIVVLQIEIDIVQVIIADMIQ
jgi:hypothetical protein